MQKLPTLVISLLVAATFCAGAQDGKLVDASVVTLPDADIQKLAATQPDIGTVLKAIELKAITYLSDGLKVKGYLAIPVKGEKLPCVIYNRGGNREFGTLTDVSAAMILGRIASW